MTEYNKARPVTYHEQVATGLVKIDDRKFTPPAPSAAEPAAERIEDFTVYTPEKSPARLDYTDRASAYCRYMRRISWPAGGAAFGLALWFGVAWQLAIPLSLGLVAIVNGIGLYDHLRSSPEHIKRQAAKETLAEVRRQNKARVAAYRKHHGLGRRQ